MDMDMDGAVDAAGRSSSAQRCHAGDLPDKILLVTQTQEVEIIEQRKECHAGIYGNAVEKE